MTKNNSGISVYVTGLQIDDVFLNKYDSGGSAEWSKYWGGNYVDSGYAVATDQQGNVYVSGMFVGKRVDFWPDVPDVESELRSSNGDEDVFLSKFNSMGEFQWV